jgi:glycosyltransferase involved in cell wall biosynthesis
LLDSSVSVIIPTHNRVDVVLRALSSVFTQTRPPDEVIVVDDGSTDDTPDRIPELFPEAVFLRQENQGVSAARNRGIHEARGDLLAFLDSDDEWLPLKLERQLQELEKSPELPLCHTNEIWIRNGRRVNPMKKHRKYGGRIFDKCLPLCIISPSSALLHRSLLDRVGLFDESLPVCEDYDLWLRICALHPVLYLKEPLIVKYGGHSDQLSRRHRGMDRFRIRALEKVIDSGALSEADHNAAIRALLEKTEIYLSGAIKRDKQEEVELYQEKKRRYEALLE